MNRSLLFPFSQCILGQRIDAVTLPAVLSDIRTSVRTKRKSLYLALNIHIFLELRRSASEKSTFSMARVVYSDGVPFVWLSRLVAQSLPGRVSGTDLVQCLLLQPRNRIFVIGGSTEIFEKLRQRYGSVIVGYFIPPFGAAWDEDVDEAILDQIHRVQPDIIFVAVGALKQERWLWKHFAKTPAFAGLGVGSALEILSGEKPRAPQWMQSMALEWLWRIFLEPGRLWRRYLIDGKDFLMVLLSERRK